MVTAEKPAIGFCQAGFMVLTGFLPCLTAIHGYLLRTILWEQGENYVEIF